MLRQSPNINLNYAAKVARIDAIEPIPDAHSIVRAVLGTDKVVVSKDMAVGDIVVFFPVGCCITDKYLGAHNLYESGAAEKNSNYPEYSALHESILALMTKPDKQEEDISKLQELQAQQKRMVGFFNKQGRVRCLKLRGEMSMGYVAPVETLEKVWPELRGCKWICYVGTEFDVVCGDMLCWKWVPPVKSLPEDDLYEAGYKMPWYKKSLRKLKKFDRLIPGFFKPHYDTAMLERNANLIDPQNDITLTVKFHGTSVILADLPVRRKLGFFKKAAKAIGLPIRDTEFGNIYSTRRVIQNKYINPFASRANKEPNNEYAAVNRDFAGFLTPGQTVYGEIVGYTPAGKFIQAPKGIGHDYGAMPGQYRFMPYRITDTDMDGNVHEWIVDEVMKWADDIREQLPANEKYKIITMDLLYEGRAGDMYNNLYAKIAEETTDDEYRANFSAYRQSPEFNGFFPKWLESPEEYVKNKWRIAWIDAMKKDKTLLGMELPEPHCKNKKAPREGVVLRIVGDKTARAWKLKTAAHQALSQKAADAGEVDPEDFA